jgi:hypothetical protein
MRWIARRNDDRRRDGAVTVRRRRASSDVWARVGLALVVRLVVACSSSEGSFCDRAIEDCGIRFRDYDVPGECTVDLEAYLETLRAAQRSECEAALDACGAVETCEELDTCSRDAVEAACFD